MMCCVWNPLRHNNPFCAASIEGRLDDVLYLPSATQAGQHTAVFADTLRQMVRAAWQGDYRLEQTAEDSLTLFMEQTDAAAQAALEQSLHTLCERLALLPPRLHFAPPAPNGTRAQIPASAKVMPYAQRHVELSLYLAVRALWRWTGPFACTFGGQGVYGGQPAPAHWPFFAALSGLCTNAPAPGTGRTAAVPGHCRLARREHIDCIIPCAEGDVWPATGVAGTLPPADFPLRFFLSWLFVQPCEGVMHLALLENAGPGKLQRAAADGLCYQTRVRAFWHWASQGWAVNRNACAFRCWRRKGWAGRNYAPTRWPTRAN